MVLYLFRVSVPSKKWPLKEVALLFALVPLLCIPWHVRSDLHEKLLWLKDFIPCQRNIGKLAKFFYIYNCIKSIHS